MLATQDVQPSAATQLAFVELPGGNSELADELLKVLHQKHLLDLRAAGLAVRFADTDEFDKQGFASPIDWIRFNGHLTSVAAADLIAVGENLERLPQTVQAVRDGEIGFPHLKTMARTANFIGGGFDETKLLPKAKDNSAGKFYYICDHYRHSLDPKAYEAEQTERVENRKLTITTCDDGAVLIKGVFDPRVGLLSGRRSSRWRASQTPMTTGAGRSGWRMRRWKSLCTRWTSERFHSRRRSAPTCRSPFRSRPCSDCPARLVRTWSSHRSPSPPRRWSGWLATPRSRASCSTRSRW